MINKINRGRSAEYISNETILLKMDEIIDAINKEQPEEKKDLEAQFLKAIELIKNVAQCPHCSCCQEMASKYLEYLREMDNIKAAAFIDNCEKK